MTLIPAPLQTEPGMGFMNAMNGAAAPDGTLLSLDVQSANAAVVSGTSAEGIQRRVEVSKRYLYRPTRFPHPHSPISDVWCYANAAMFENNQPAMDFSATVSPNAQYVGATCSTPQALFGVVLDFSINLDSFESAAISTVVGGPYDNWPHAVPTTPGPTGLLDLRVGSFSQLRSPIPVDFESHFPGAPEPATYFSPAFERVNPALEAGIAGLMHFQNVTTPDTPPQQYFLELGRWGALAGKAFAAGFLAAAAAIICIGPGVAVCVAGAFLAGVDGVLVNEVIDVATTHDGGSQGDGPPSSAPPTGGPPPIPPKEEDTDE